MTIREAITVLREMPYPPRVFGEAIDVAIERMENEVNGSLVGE